MKKLIIVLVLLANVIWAQGQTAQPAPAMPANSGVSNNGSLPPARNFRTELYHATPAGDRFIIHELRKHLRQLNREERHLRKELRRLRRERMMHPQAR